MKRIVALPGLILMMFASGCYYELRDEIAECQIKYSNYWAAQSAWQNSSDTCMGVCCPHSFKEGFFAGYSAIANGGNGCPPVVPEFPCCNHMWLDRCSESEKMQAWYDGYEIGVIAARSDGMADVNRIYLRLPQPVQIDYSNVNGAAPTGTTPDSAVPPMPSPTTPSVPAPDPGYADGPQTNLAPSGAVPGYSTTSTNAF